MSGTTTTYSSSASELRALVNLLSASVDKIEASLDARSQTFPVSAEPFNPQTEAVRMAPDIAEQTATIVAAASQLVFAARMPALSLLYGSNAVGCPNYALYV